MTAKALPVLSTGQLQLAHVNNIDPDHVYLNSLVRVYVAHHTHSTDSRDCGMKPKRLCSDYVDIQDEQLMLEIKENEHFFR